jgi:hypothetical protein
LLREREANIMWWKTIAAAAIVSVFGVGSARAADNQLTVAGFTLGQPLPAAQCKSYPPTADSDYTAGRCWGTERATNDEHIKLVFFNGAPPPIGFAMRAYTDANGMLDGLSFETRGVSDEEDVLRALRAKYGKPNVLQTKQFMTGFGARAKGYHAEWSSGQVYVEFDGINDRLDRGWVKIDTAAEHAAHLDAQRRFLQNAPHL